MEKLPAELLLMVNNRLSDEDSLNMRLVCRKFHLHLTPVIFREVECAYLPNSFQNLLNICSAPSLKEHISELCYYATVRPVVSRDEWEQHIRFPAHIKKAPTHPKIPDALNMTAESLSTYATEVRRWTESCSPATFYAEAELQNGYRVYENTIAAQKSLENSQVDFTSLSESTSCLKNLKIMRTFTNVSYNGYSSDKPSRTADLVEPSGLYELEGVNTAKFSIRQTNSVLLSIFLARPKLEELQICQIPVSVLEGHFPHGINIGAFMYLRKLDLEISDCSDELSSTAPDAENRQNILHHAIESATGLETLRLSFYHYEVEAVTKDRCDVDLIHWSRIFGQTIWPNLKELNICGIDMDPSWPDFFHRHPKLRALRLQDPYLLEKKSWVDALSDLKEIVKLDKLELRGVFWWNLANGPEIQGLLMDMGLYQLEGPWETVDYTENEERRSAPFDLHSSDEKDLSEHIENWILNDGPSPFIKKLT